MLYIVSLLLPAWRRRKRIYEKRAKTEVGGFGRTWLTKWRDVYDRMLAETGNTANCPAEACADKTERLATPPDHASMEREPCKHRPRTTQAWQTGRICIFQNRFRYSQPQQRKLLRRERLVKTHQGTGEVSFLTAEDKAK